MAGKGNRLSNSGHVKFVDKLDGRVHKEYLTDPSKFAIYEKNGISSGLAMTQDIADIIDNEPYGLYWERNITERIHKRYPRIDKFYIGLALYPVEMGYRNGRKERVMIIK